MLKIKEMSLMIVNKSSGVGEREEDSSIRSIIV